ncbi:MAG: Type secretion system domain protein [Variovorax sp.]|nr:Type secretion system domain protein [Variovorax sp.]
MNFPAKPKIRAQFFRELAQLTASGISVVQAGQVLGQHWRGKEVRAAVGEMERGLAAGGTIAGALAPELTPMEFSIIDSAERGGKLAQGFRHLEEYYHLLDQTWDRVRSALLYPIFMLHAAVLLPALVSAVTSGENVLLALLRGLLMIWGLLALLVLAGRTVGRMAETVPAVDRLLGWIPLLGSARKTLALARWHAVLHFNIASSQRISEGLRQAGAATASSSLREASDRAARAVDDGAELGNALIAESAFPKDMASALASAEFSGNLDTETQRLYRETVAAAATRLETSTKRLCGVFYALVVLITAVQILRMAGGYVGQYEKALKDLDL